MSPPADAPNPSRKTRPYYWSVRREIWENRAIYLAPLAMAGVVLAAFLYSSLGLPAAVLKASAPEGGGVAEVLQLPYAAAAGVSFVITFLVAIFYCLGALHGERRDRSLLFWKSLPVSDWTTVLSKLAIPMLVQPVAVLVIAVAAQLLMLLWSTTILLLNGIDPGLLWGRLNLPLMWVVLPFGLAVNTLWSVPVYAWLMVVSAWAKRMTFVWAVAPPLALCLFEALAFRTGHVFEFLTYRLFGGLAQAFSVDGKGETLIQSLGDVDPLRVLVSPDLWGGFALAALGLGLCVALRRRSDPI